MPPFVLEPLKHAPSKERKERIIFTKATYNTKVKITDWEKYRESEPIDNDPLCIGSVNHHLSHYNRFGIEPDEKYVTTTQLMLEQINNKERSFTNMDKKLVNYYTYSDNIDCDQNNLPRSMLCPKVCAEKYYTTMQNSYRPPHFYTLRRVALPKIPHLQNRRFRHEEPTLSEYKFYDEGFHIKTRNMIHHKKAQWISFNPYTGLYNNGTVPADGEKKCVEINYDDY